MVERARGLFGGAQVHPQNSGPQRASVIRRVHASEGGPIARNRRNGIAADASVIETHPN
jgi:hypothetical protein